MLADMNFFANDNKIQIGLAQAAQAFGSNSAYELSPGDKPGEQDVIFSDHFMQVFRYALSTDSKCAITAMSDEELSLYYAFIDYENGTPVSDEELAMVAEQLDDCLMDELRCAGSCTTNASYGECSIEHSWMTCNN